MKERPAPPQGKATRGMTRRSFLHRSIAAGVALGTALNTRMLGDSAVPARTHEQMQKKERPQKRSTPEEREEYMGQLKELLEFMSECESQYGPVVSRTPEERDAVHEAFQNRFGSTVQRMAALADGAGVLASLYVLLGDCDSQGQVYRYLEHHRGFAIEDDRAVSPYANQELHYKARVADFLPQGKDIYASDVDQRHYLSRVVFANQGTFGTEIAEGMAELPGWSTKARREQFRSVLDNPRVRSLLQSSNCTLAEAYSIVKAAIRRQERSLQEGRPMHVVVEELLNERAQFLEQEIAGPDTKAFIVLDYEKKEDDPTAAFPQSLPETVARSAGVPAEVIRSISTATHPNTVRGELTTTIETSQGQTCIYLNTHGTRDHRLALNQYESVSSAEIGAALARRVVRSNDMETLRDVTVIIAACYGYDMVDHLLKGIYDAIQKTDIPFERVMMPSIITAAQEGSISMTNTFLSAENHSEILEREGGLLGSFFMRVVQPEAYSKTDMTFFEGGQRGYVSEIGALEKPLSDARPA